MKNLALLLLISIVITYLLGPAAGVAVFLVANLFGNFNSEEEE